MVCLFVSSPQKKLNYIHERAHTHTDTHMLHLHPPLVVASRCNSHRRERRRKGREKSKKKYKHEHFFMNIRTRTCYNYIFQLLQQALAAITSTYLLQIVGKAEVVEVKHVADVRAIDVRSVDDAVIERSEFCVNRIFLDAEKVPAPPLGVSTEQIISFFGS